MIIFKGIVTIIWVLLYLLMYYLLLPPLSLAYFSGFAFIAFGLIWFSVPLSLWISKDVEEPEDILYELNLKPFFISIIICASSFIIGGVAGSALLNSSAMYNQLGKIEEKNFKSDIVEIDTAQIPTVDIKLASKLADKKLGEELALGSQVNIGTFTNKQQVNSKLIYVAPLEHSGFWKWNQNQHGTPGYIIVSATNQNDVQLVRDLNGKSIDLKYLKSAFFSSDLKRHIRSNGYRTVGLSDFSFELDDNGTPYWVVSTYENATLWRNPEVTGIIICDAQTGKCEWYSVEDAPEWVDIVQPEDFIINQIENYGKLVHGVFNFSDKDKLSMTKHITTVYNNNNCYYYTGLSSVGTDNSTVGFIMINTRNKSATLYRMVGATEEAAMRSAEGKVQNMGYKATTPIPLNVSGVPSYFCTLKDDEGLVKEYAMLKIEDYSIVENGSSIIETKRSYLNSVNNSGASIDFGDAEVYGYSLTGTVTRIGSNIENGNTYYYFIIDDDADKLFFASYMISDELPITREGDTVEISYIDESNGAINIVTFDNVGFAQPMSEKQEKINESQEQENIINNPEHSVISVDPDANQKTWDNLTDEEKAKLLQSLQDE